MTERKRLPQPKRTKTFDEALLGAKRMSERYVQRGPFRFFPEAEVVVEVQRGLAENEVKHGYRYCPWMPLSGDPVEDRKKICPCDRHQEDIERDGFCLWMFFVSEEFLRKYESGEEFEQTLDQTYKPGEGLFDEYIAADQRKKSQADQERADAA